MKSVLIVWTWELTGKLDAALRNIYIYIERERERENLHNEPEWVTTKYETQVG